MSKCPKGVPLRTKLNNSYSYMKGIILKSAVLYMHVVEKVNLSLPILFLGRMSWYAVVAIQSSESGEERNRPNQTCLNDSYSKDLFTRLSKL